MPSSKMGFDPHHDEDNEVLNLEAKEAYGFLAEEHEQKDD
tara:strand:- start:7 stop:126 length:120 start_codon:yes stop_codon:yes gene_type:complete